jgi:hypothetical protein
MTHAFRPALVSAFILCLFVNASAVKWIPEEFTCPIDNEKNTFLTIVSYGTYIYSYPSKYQWLFFPYTDTPTYYTCKKCYLTTYMWDFDKLPKDKLPEIKKILADVKVSKSFKGYLELPVSERLEIMEKIYPVLEKDADWWENFYRVKGYHYGKEGKAEKAAESRRKSLEMIQKELANEKSESPRKLLLYVSASMKHFLGDDKAALEDLQKALTTQYQKKDADDETLKKTEEGMNERIRDYIEKIKSEKQKPRLFDVTDSEY